MKLRFTMIFSGSDTNSTVWAQPVASVNLRLYSTDAPIEQVLV
jgi:hypothetical protein